MGGLFGTSHLFGKLDEERRMGTFGKITSLKLPFADVFKQGAGIVLIESRSTYIVETIKGHLPHTT